MKINVRYISCLFDESTWIQFQSHNETVKSILISLFQQYPQIRKDSLNIMIRVNGKKLHPSKWRQKLNDGDEVLIIQEIGGEWIVTVLAAIGLTYSPAIAAGLFGMTLVTTINVGLAILSIAYSIYSYCTASKAPYTGSGAGLNNSPTYGWEGSQMQVRQGVPVPIVYGEHLVGGNLIDCYISSYSDKNYLNMLIALSEGEIEGIMKEDLSGTCSVLPRSAEGLITFTGIPVADDNMTIGGRVLTWMGGTYLPPGTIFVGATTLECVMNAIDAINRDIGNLVIADKWTGNAIRVTAVDPGVAGNTITFTESSALTSMSGGGFLAGGINGDMPYVLINDNLLSNYRSVSYDYRTGTQSQTAIAGFGNVHQTYSTSGVLLGFVPYTYTTVDSDVEAIEVRVRVPAMYVQYRGDYYPRTLCFIVEHKLTSSGTWIVDGKMTITNSSLSPIRRYYKIDNLTAGRYNVRLTEYQWDGQVTNDSTIVGRIYLDNVIEIKRDSLAYPHTALLALKIMATEQLSGGIPNVLTRIRGIKVYNLSTTATAWTKNPIYNINNLMVNTRYGVGNYITQSNVNVDQFILMAAYCDTVVDAESRFELDIVIDSFNPAFDTINQICGSFRATPIWNKDAIQLLIDKAETPSYIFNMGSIIEGSFSHTFTSEKSKANSIIVDFADKAKRFQKETVEITDSAVITGGTPRRTRNMSLIGASRQSQVYREARYHLYAVKYQDEQISFRGAIDAIHVLPGDVVKFQHDTFEWGIGGRVVTATAVSITVDQSITIVGGHTYTLTCKLSNDTLESKTLTNAAGVHTVLTVAGPGFTSAPPAFGIYVVGETGVDVKTFRIMSLSKTPNNEIEVTATEYSASVYSDAAIIVATPSIPPSVDNPPPPDIIPGLMVPPECTGLTLTNATDAMGIVISFTIPSSLTNWSYGEIQVSSNLGVTYSTVTTFNQQKSYTYRDVIAGATYWVKILSFSNNGVVGTSPPTSSIVIAGSVVTPAVPTGLALTTGISKNADATDYSWVYANWNDNVETNFANYEYRIKETGGYYTYGFVTSSDILFTNIRSNILYYVGVRAINDYGTSSAFCTDVSVTSAKDTTAPAVPTALAASSTFKTIVLTWTNPADSDLDYINIYRGTTAVRGGATLVAQVNGTSYVDNLGSYGLTRYYWISAVDTSGNISTETGPVNETTGMVSTSDIDTFAILASQIYTKIPIITGDAWIDNSPGAGSVAWNGHSLVFNGITYAISSSNTSLKYIYWLGPLFGSANSAVTTTLTTLTDTRLSMTVNKYAGIIVNCNGKTLTVTSNTATTFTGAAWSPVGAPGNGYEWSTNNCLSPFSGTANAAVTTTSTSLTDTRLIMKTNEYVGITITCNLKTMIVVSNTSTTFTGASWSGGGTPGDGLAWSTNERVKALSGTTNDAVSTTTISLTDTRLALTVNKYAGEIITCNNKEMTIVSNTATTFTGTSWSGGGTPGNGLAWLTKPVTFYFKSETHPGSTLGDSDFIIAVNNSGVHDLAWNAIANEVIGSAYIQNAAIKTAKIDDLQVTTIKIGNNAVSNRSEVRAASFLVNSATWQDALTLEVTTNGGSIIILGRLTLSVPTGTHVELQLKRDSTLLDGILYYYPTSVEETVTFIDLDAPLAGTYTYKIQASIGNTYSTTLYHLALLATEYLK